VDALRLAQQPGVLAFAAVFEWWRNRKTAPAGWSADFAAVSAGVVLGADRQIAGLDDRLSDRS
jgi:hypothetical protein